MTTENELTDTQLDQLREMIAAVGPENFRLVTEALLRESGAACPCGGGGCYRCFGDDVGPFMSAVYRDVEDAVKERKAKQDRLKLLREMFDAQGGRGVELADEIDRLEAEVGEG
jgi:hypothetical protein